MKRKLPLIFLSLATLLLLTFHIADDTIRQAEGSMTYPIPVTVFTLMLAATLMGSDRLWGHIVMLLGGLFGVAMIVVHAKGVVVRNSGGFFAARPHCLKHPVPISSVFPRNPLVLPRALIAPVNSAVSFRTVRPDDLTIDGR